MKHQVCIPDYTGPVAEYDSLEAAEACASVLRQVFPGMLVSVWSAKR